MGRIPFFRFSVVFSIANPGVFVKYVFRFFLTGGGIYGMMGTEFQKSVWAALVRIPYGQTRTYGQIAADIGRPKAARAVGMACNQNPVWIAIPCHRVLGRNGALTGYAGGLDLKQKLLELEHRNA